MITFDAVASVTPTAPWPSVDLNLDVPGPER